MTTTTEVEAFLDAWAEAERTQDTGFLATRMTDDFVGVGPLGFALPKAAWIGRHRSGDLRYDTYEFDEVDVRRHGDVAVVTARQDAVGAYHGNPLPRYLRATVVLVESDGDWAINTVHLSFVAGTPGAPPIPGMPAHAEAGTNERARHQYGAQPSAGSGHGVAEAGCRPAVDRESGYVEISMAHRNAQAFSRRSHGALPEETGLRLP